jgi:hypothetical protein
MPELTLSPSQGLRIWPQEDSQKKPVYNKASNLKESFYYSLYLHSFTWQKIEFALSSVSLKMF